MIAIIDYGIGNLQSVRNMLRKAGTTDVCITGAAEDVARADRIILPGVGHFDYGMRRLREVPCYEVLQQKALVEKVPVLGICLGAQLLTRGSEEGTEPGLGWVDADTLRFQVEGLPVPHMGWSDVTFGDHPLFRDMYPEPRFYFVHSYYLKPAQPSGALCRAEYGQPFAAGIVRDNIFGVQFHPEKSHKFGMKLLQNFSTL
ncbi:MAG: imidazole glycerol phosphate synthase subunit HisH [Chitinophagaceae bacterium]|nr:MAG: imidazole glycerol phosphate synthase subunit HisH [Chitinophagaceae bacterium]